MLYYLCKAVGDAELKCPEPHELPGSKAKGTRGAVPGHGSLDYNLSLARVTRRLPLAPACPAAAAVALAAPGGRGHVPAQPQTWLCRFISAEQGAG